MLAEEGHRLRHLLTLTRLDTEDQVLSHRVTYIGQESFAAYVAFQDHSCLSALWRNRPSSSVPLPVTPVPEEGLW